MNDYRLDVLDAHSSVDRIVQVYNILRNAFGSENCSYDLYGKNYILYDNTNNHKIVAFCSIVTATDCVIDLSNDFAGKHVLKKELVYNLPRITVHNMLYNLARDEADKFKGAGKILLDQMNQNEAILLSSVHPKVVDYYYSLGFMETNIFDFDPDTKQYYRVLYRPESH